MKYLLLIVTALFLFACADKKEDTYVNLTKSNSDTLVVGKDSSTVCFFSVSSKPGIYSDQIVGRAYSGDLAIEYDQIAVKVVDYSGLQTSKDVTASIYIAPETATGYYKVVFYGDNTQSSGSLSYILYVR